MSFTIGQAAAQARVAASTLRYWERQGLLNPARSNSQRRYDREDMRRAALLKLAGTLQLPWPPPWRFSTALQPTDKSWRRERWSASMT